MVFIKSKDRNPEKRDDDQSLAKPEVLLESFSDEQLKIAGIDPKILREKAIEKTDKSDPNQPLATPKALLKAFSDEQLEKAGIDADALREKIGDDRFILYTTDKRLREIWKLDDIADLDEEVKRQQIQDLREMFRSEVEGPFKIGQKTVSPCLPIFNQNDELVKSENCRLFVVKEKQENGEIITVMGFDTLEEMRNFYKRKEEEIPLLFATTVCCNACKELNRQNWDEDEGEK